MRIGMSQPRGDDGNAAGIPEEGERATSGGVTWYNGCRGLERHAAPELAPAHARLSTQPGLQASVRRPPREPGCHERRPQTVDAGEVATPPCARIGDRFQRATQGFQGGRIKQYCWRGITRDRNGCQLLARLVCEWLDESDFL